MLLKLQYHCVTSTLNMTFSDTTTPILDFAGRLPKRSVSKRLARLSVYLVVGGLIGLGFALAENLGFGSIFGVLSPGIGVGQLSPIQFFPFLILAMFLIMTLHEIGHLIGGKCVGFGFVGMQIGPFLLTNHGHKLKVKLRLIVSLNGLALVKIDRLTRITRRLAVFVLGGPIATAAGALAGYLLLKNVEQMNDLLFDFIQLFTHLSLLTLALNLFPFRTHTRMFSDGARLRMLFLPSGMTRRWLSIIALGFQIRSGKRARFLNQRWLRTANQYTDRSCDELLAAWYAYICSNDCENTDAAANHLEHCLSLSHLGCGVALRDILCLEASVFQAWFRGDREKSEAWRQNVKNIRVLPWFAILRADTALLWSQGKHSEALTKCDEALQKLGMLPPEVNKESFELGYLEWKQKMIERANSSDREALSVALQVPALDGKSHV